MGFNLSTKNGILIVSAILSFIVIMIYFVFFKFDTMTLSYLGVIIISIMLFPVSFYDYSFSSKLSVMEEQFPIFLKDLADNLRAGLSITDAVRTVSNNDYRALNTEIRRLSNQMSWGVSFEKSIQEMTKRLKKSILISRGLSILVQAFKSGGDISPIMNSVAESTILLQNVQKDQETSMVQQVSIIYMIQLVFVGILIVLFSVLIPITTSGAFSSGTDFGMGTQTNVGLNVDYYKGFFFITLVIQSICNGFVAGYTKNNNLLSGVKHIAIMFAFSLTLFTLFILPKSLSITAASESYSIVLGQTFNVAGKVSYDDVGAENAVVEIIIDNNVYTGTTSALGEYRIIVNSPSQRGKFEGLAKVNYDGKTAQTGFSITVR